MIGVSIATTLASPLSDQAKRWPQSFCWRHGAAQRTGLEVRDDPRTVTNTCALRANASRQAAVHG